MIHERIDIGLASVNQMASQSGKPLGDFLPTWWDWLEEAEEDDDYQADEAGQMIATMRAMSEKWRKRREAEEVSDGGERSGGSHHGGRDEPEARLHAGDGGE